MDVGGADSLGAAISSAGERLTQLHSAFVELKAFRGTLSLEWSDLEQDLLEREGSLRRQYEDLVAKERDFESRSSEILSGINSRVAIAEEKLREQQEFDELAKGGGNQPMETDVDYSPAKREEATTRRETLEKAEVRVRPYLKSLCENMDGEGLRKYVVDHRKDMGALRSEMPSALQHATDPARLVLDAVQGYYQQEGSNDKKEVGTSANRRACILLLEALSSVLGDDHPVVPLDIKFLVRDLAEQWRSKMDVQEAPDGNSLDAQAFLQLLAAYGLGSEYDEEELCRLVLAISRRKQTPALCKALNLSHKIPEIMEHLTNDGKQIEALAFAHAFDMMGRVEPVALLKAYLKDARKNVHKSGNGGQGQNDTVTKELAALKNVLKCIEDYNLERNYPSSPLHRRVAHLERTKSERKRTGGSVKGQAKRARNAGYERSYYRSSDKAQVFNNVSVSPYNLGPQSAYDTRRPAGYSTYAPPTAAAAAAAAASGRSRTPAGNSYIYSVDGNLYGSSLYGTQSASYSNYQLATGLPPPPAAYQASFMH